MSTGGGLGQGPGGRLGGLAGGGGVSRPTPGGRFGGLTGGLHAHTLGGLQTHTWGEFGVQAQVQAQGIQAWVRIPACTEADISPDGYCCGSYTSYRNAFLLHIM